MSKTVYEVEEAPADFLCRRCTYALREEMDGEKR